MLSEVDVQVIYFMTQSHKLMLCCAILSTCIAIHTSLQRFAKSTNNIFKENRYLAAHSTMRLSTIFINPYKNLCTWSWKHKANY